MDHKELFDMVSSGFTPASTEPEPAPAPVDEEILKKAARRYAKSKGVTQDNACNELLNNPELIAKWQ